MRENFQTNENALAEENPSETISPMAATTIANNTTYTFKNVGTRRMLNLWGGLTTNATNVCQYSADGSNEQKWTRRGSKLYTNTSTSKCLDRYVGGGGAYNNADIYDDNDDENQNLEFVWRSGYVAVRLAGTSYYLTASSNAGTDSLMNSSGNTSAYKAPDAAGNVFWKFVSSTASLNNYNLWEANQVTTVVTGDGQYLALPINNCTITAMYQEDSSPAYNHEYDSAGHFGLDMYGSVNPFYASGIGKVIAVGGTPTAGVGYWAAVQYDNVLAWNMSNDSLKKISSIVMRYYHLQSKPNLTSGQAVNLNTVIGTYGNTGFLDMKPHLHVECDTDVEHPLYTPTLGNSSGGLYAGIRGAGATTFDPCSIFFIKNTAPENQSLRYDQSYCDKHPSAYESYINVTKMNRFIEQQMSKYF